MFGKNTFYKSFSKHGHDAKKNYFVFSIIDDQFITFYQMKNIIII